MECRRPTALAAKQLRLAEKSISVESHEVILRILIEAFAPKWCRDFASQLDRLGLRRLADRRSSAGSTLKGAI
jgi:hypothetical protein